ncbi:unnamed protein product, partial [Discosporangium mesarthrocarpum]
WRDVQFTFYVSVSVGAGLLVLFEVCRGYKSRMCRSIYRQRHSLRYRKINDRLKRIKVIPFPRGFLAWIPATIRVSEDTFYKQVGMDGHITMRFIRLCKRLCMMASFLGLVLMMPLYHSGTEQGPDADEISKLTMANLKMDDPLLWGPVVFAWLLTIYLLYSIRLEARIYSDLRNDWLAGRDASRTIQTSYTMMVETIPSAFRSPATLQKFFSTLFPGQIHSAVVCLGLRELQNLTSRRDKAGEEMERARIMLKVRNL